MPRLTALIPLLLLAICAGGAVYLLTRSPAERPEHFQSSVGRSPNYDLASLEGSANVRPSNFAGRVYVINLFASWCTPCRAEHPVLMRLRESGVPMLGVAYRDRPQATRQFLNELGDPFTARALDPEGHLLLELGSSGVPETLVIGPDGRVLAQHRGPLTMPDLERDILPALR